MVGACEDHGSPSCSRRSPGFSSPSSSSWRVSWSFVCRDAARGSTAPSVPCSSSPPRSTRLGTGATTPRKRWGSSPCSLLAGPARAPILHSSLGFDRVPSWRWALGTLFGGWRIVHTMGSKITRLTPCKGSARKLGAPSHCSWHGSRCPGLTTHTITGAIVGVGAARRVSAVRWNIARGNIVAPGS